MTEPDIKQIEAALPRMRDRWLGGGDASQVAPAGWPGGQTTLLALAGHALETLRMPAPAGQLAMRPALPQLALPPLIDDRRVLLRRALTAAKADVSGQTALIRLLAARRFSVHPDDWWPPLTQMQEVEVYAPWAAWREGSASRIASDIPTADTWQDWSWTERRNALARLRSIDPAAGRALLQTVFASEPAEKRLVLLDTMAKGLGGEDAPFLESLGSDRSDKVKQLAKRMLTRLGRFSAPGDTETELADFFETGKKGILRRSASMSLKPLKTPAQHQRLHELLELTTLPAFAAKLGLSEVELVQAWETSKQSPDVMLVALVMLTGSPAAVEAMVVRFEDDFPLHPAMASRLNELVPDEVRARLVAAGIRREGDIGFYTTLILANQDPGTLTRQAIEKSAAWKALIEAASIKDENGERQRELQLARGLAALGLLCSADAARWVIDTFTGLGLSPADPGFNILALNAALDERPSA